MAIINERDTRRGEGRSLTKRHSREVLFRKEGAYWKEGFRYLRKTKFVTTTLVNKKLCLATRYDMSRFARSCETLPINKQAKQCPLALNQSKTSPSMSGDSVQCVSMSATHAQRTVVVTCGLRPVKCTSPKERGIFTDLLYHALRA